VENIFFDLKKLKSCGDNVIIGKTVRIRNPELVEIGNNVIIDDFTYISGNISIGNYVHIAASCTLQASKSKITLSDFAALASGCRVVASGADFVNCGFDYATAPSELRYGGVNKEVYVGKYVQVGLNSVVLPGSNLPIGFTCGALSKLVDSFTYKAWSILVNDEDGSCVRRTGVRKLIEQSNKVYE
jgi:acetyltransferase-like isoleucine patch superfamily enzyme